MRAVCLKIADLTQDELRLVYDRLVEMSSGDVNESLVVSECWSYVGIDTDGDVLFWDSPGAYDVYGEGVDTFGSAEAFFEVYGRPGTDVKQSIQELIDTAQEEEERMLAERLFVAFAQHAGQYGDPKECAKAAREWAVVFYREDD